MNERFKFMFKKSQRGVGTAFFVGSFGVEFCCSVVLHYLFPKVVPLFSLVFS